MLYIEFMPKMATGIRTYKDTKNVIIEKVGDGGGGRCRGKGVSVNHLGKNPRSNEIWDLGEG